MATGGYGAKWVALSAKREFLTFETSK